jgi:hypothetical protein
MPALLTQVRNLTLDVVHRLRVRRMSAPSERERRLMDKLRTEVREAVAATEVDDEWTKFTGRLSTLVETTDPRAFLAWDVIRDTMFVDYARFMRDEFSYLRNLPEWRSRWAPAVQETSAGHPLPYLWYPKSSANLLHHAYHLARFEQLASTRVDAFERVIEFGAGYGSANRLIRKLGFRGSYVMHDLPMFAALQRYFLASAGLEDDQNTWVTSVEQLAPFLKASAPKTLFVAMWSLSETPLDLRTNVLESVRGCDAFMICYQQRWNNVDNVRFFNDWAESRPDLRCHREQLGHLPGNYYMVATQR